MSKKITPAMAVINRFGSIRKASIELELSRSAIMNWRRRGVVPSKHHKLIMRKLKRKISYKVLVLGE